MNWVKGAQGGKKKLFKQLGDDSDSPWEVVEVDSIGPSLSGRFDVTQARRLEVNAQSNSTYQGQTHGHEGFLLNLTEGNDLLRRDPSVRDVLFPYLTADELLRTVPPAPQRYVIDFFPRDVLTSQRYREPFTRIESTVLPTREEAAARERARNEEALSQESKARVNNHHANFLRKWWQLSYPRGELIGKLKSLSRYVVCGRVTKRPIFVFLAPEVRPNDALQVFAFEDDYSFGILQSSAHWEWFTERCSTLKGDYRYTSNTVYDSFPWPQGASLAQVRDVSRAAKMLRDLRRELILVHRISLRDLYRTLERPGDHPLKDAHAELDEAVRAAYGIRRRDQILDFLFELNRSAAGREEQMESVVGPGLPPCVKSTSEFITGDCFPMQIP